MTYHSMPRLALAVSFVLIASLVPYAQGLAISARDDKPAFLTQSSEALDEKWNKLVKAALFKDSKEEAENPDELANIYHYEDNDELWYDDHFARYSTYMLRYGEAEWVKPEINPFEGDHPYYAASRIPAIDDDKVFPYIALQSPLINGKGKKTMYWDIIWENTENAAVIVNLLDTRPRKGRMKLAEKEDDLIPQSKTEPLSFEKIDKDTGETTCDTKYTVDLEDSENLVDQPILYRKLRLVNKEEDGKDGKGKTLHYIHYTAWPDSSAIGAEDMKKLLAFIDEKQKDVESVDGKQVTVTPMYVNCKLGLGRTGTVIVSRELQRVGKSWLQANGADGADPIAQYVTAMRLIRGYMIDSESQFEFLYEWANDIYANDYFG